MFVDEVRSLCDEADWIVKCGGTRNGYRANYAGFGTPQEQSDAIFAADENELRRLATRAIDSGLRSNVKTHKNFALLLREALDTENVELSYLLDVFKNHK